MSSYSILIVLVGIHLVFSSVLTCFAQRQDRYKAVQSLVDHLDAKVNDSWEIKQGILDTLSKCVAVAADGSLGKSCDWTCTVHNIAPLISETNFVIDITWNNLFTLAISTSNTVLAMPEVTCDCLTPPPPGPSVLDIFRTLVQHLRVSIETTAEGPTDLSSSLTFQRSITKTVGEFAGVLPDYHKPDILGLINSYVPVPDEGLLNVDIQGTVPDRSAVASNHPLAPQTHR